MRRNLRKLLVRQPESIVNRWRFLSEAVNHNAPIMPSNLWVWTLIVSQEGPALVRLATIHHRKYFKLQRKHPE
jgi:hypothetical protein